MNNKIITRSQIIAYKAIKKTGAVRYFDYTSNNTLTNSYFDIKNVTDEFVAGAISIACSLYGCTEKEIKSPSKLSQLADARTALMYSFRSILGTSFDFAGKLINRDHATAIYAVNKVNFYKNSKVLDARAIKILDAVEEMEKLYIIIKTK